MDKREISIRFAPEMEPPSAERLAGRGHVSAHCHSLATILNEMMPDSREKSLALTKLEEVRFWAHAAVDRLTE